MFEKWSIWRFFGVLAKVLEVCELFNIFLFWDFLGGSFFFCWKAFGFFSMLLDGSI